MKFDESRCVGFAMQAEQMMTEEALAEGGLHVDRVGQALGLTAEESREIAEYLRDINWATLSSVRGIRMRLTWKAMRELAMLRKTWLRRFVERNWESFLVALSAGLIAGLVVWFLSRAVATEKQLQTRTELQERSRMGMAKRAA